MVATDMMAEYVRQLLDLDEASLNATLHSLSRYAETRGAEDFAMPDGVAVGVPGKADKGLSMETASGAPHVTGVATPDGVGVAEQGKANSGWGFEAAYDLQHVNALAKEEADASLPPGTTALCEAMATLTKSLPPQSAAAAQDLLTAAVAEADVHLGAENGSDYNLLHAVEKVLEQQQRESAMRLLGIMQMEMQQGPVAQQLAPPSWPGVPRLAAPGLPPGLADDWAGPWGKGPAMMHPMQMQDPGVPHVASFVPPGASVWLDALKDQQNETLWYGGSQVPPAPMARKHAATPKDSGAAIGGRALAAGQRQHRKQSTREANHASTKPAGPRWKLPAAPQETSEETIRAHLRWLQNVDPARVLLVRKINRLGFESPAALTMHFSWYGPVERVLVSHSRVKTVQHPTGTVSSRLRPSGVGFVVMDSPELAKAILAEGREHTVAGVAINVHMFERRQTEEGSLGSPIDDEAD